MEEAQTVTTLTMDDGLDACFEMLSEGAKRRFMLEWLPPWAKAVHADSTINTTTRQLLWKTLLEKGELMITARDAMKAAAANTLLAGAQLHHMGRSPGMQTLLQSEHAAILAGRSPELRGLEQTHKAAYRALKSAEARVLQTMATDTQPTLQQLLQHQLEVNRALQAYHARSLDPAEDDIAEFNSGMQDVSASLHVLPVGHKKICCNCHQCSLVGHMDADCDAPPSEEKLDGIHYSMWTLQVASEPQ